MIIRIPKIEYFVLMIFNYNLNYNFNFNLTTWPNKKYIFPNSMEKSVLYLGYFSISFEKITFYTEIST